MVQLATAPRAEEIEPPAAVWLGHNAATNASIARYLRAGERMRVIADTGWKMGAVFVVVLVAAWAFGLLPGAVRPF